MLEYSHFLASQAVDGDSLDEFLGFASEHGAADDDEATGRHDIMGGYIFLIKYIFL